MDDTKLYKPSGLVISLMGMLEILYDYFVTCIVNEWRGSDFVSDS